MAQPPLPGTAMATATTMQRLLRRALQPLLLVGALLLAAHRLPGAEARDEARLKAQLGALID